MSKPDDDEILAFTVASVWREERVSCPHPDILQAFESGALEPGAMAPSRNQPFISDLPPAHMLTGLRVIERCFTTIAIVLRRGCIPVTRR